MLLSYLMASSRLFGQAVDWRLQTGGGVTENAQVSAVSTSSFAESDFTTSLHSGNFSESFQGKVLFTHTNWKLKSVATTWRFQNKMRTRFCFHVGLNQVARFWGGEGGCTWSTHFKTRHWWDHHDKVVGEEAAAAVYLSMPPAFVLRVLHKQMRVKALIQTKPLVTRQTQTKPKFWETKQNRLFSYIIFATAKSASGSFKEKCESPCNLGQEHFSTNWLAWFSRK